MDVNLLHKVNQADKGTENQRLREVMEVWLEMLAPIGREWESGMEDEMV